MAPLPAGPLSCPIAAPYVALQRALAIVAVLRTYPRRERVRGPYSVRLSAPIIVPGHSRSECRLITRPGGPSSSTPSPGTLVCSLRSGQEGAFTVIIARPPPSRVSFRSLAMPPAPRGDLGKSRDPFFGPCPIPKIRPKFYAHFFWDLYTICFSGTSNTILEPVCSLRVV